MKITKEQIKDIAIRTFKTFIVAVFAALVVQVESFYGISDVEGMKEFIYTAVLSAVMAGLTAVLNIVIKLFKNWLDDKKLTQEEINEAIGGERGAGTITFNKFIDKYLGKATDIDGTAGVQCVDLAKMYLKEVLGITPKAIGNAHAYFDNFKMHSFLYENFKRISNTPDFVPLKGDICVWSKSLNGYGHISIATGEGNTKKFYTYDQNWGGKACKKVEHNYKYFLGVLRPNDRSAIGSTPGNLYYSRYTGESVSFSDALYEKGINGSFANRKKIAKANGIKLYTGTAKQNVQLFSKYKAGTLIKP